MRPAINEVIEQDKKQSYWSVFKTLIPKRPSARTYFEDLLSEHKKQVNPNSITDKTTEIINAMDSDNVNRPSHYVGDNGLEVRTVHENFLPRYLMWGVMSACDAYNIIKYVLRAPKKNGVEDLKKAIKHINWIIERMEAHND